MQKQHFINIFWFRRDLRLFDNHGLFEALKAGNTLPIFIFDPEITDKLEDKNDIRINFIYSELLKLDNKLKSYESSLSIFYNKPLEIFKTLCKRYRVKALYFNEDYEPYAIRRDREIASYAVSRNINVYSFKDQVIFAKSEILKNDEKPYTVFTPYSNKWKENFSKTNVQKYKSENLLNNFYKANSTEKAALANIGFNFINYTYPSREINQQLIATYDKTRDFPHLNGTSKLSVHLRFGTISIRNLVEIADELNQAFLNELIWREFYMMILWHFPNVVDNSFKRKYAYLSWNNDETDFEKWCNGQTGYPLVDAGMRELNATGFMHNRLRMVTASFLTKHLLIDWRWGEAYFAQKLLDYELSSNNGGWQWAASTGCDSVPYFRIFNPALQAQKFDKNFEYIKKWVPELNSASYPKPIVNHNYARERALNAFKQIK